VVLLVTNRDDLTADWLVLEFRARRCEFLRLNTEDLPRRLSIRLSEDAAVLCTSSGDLPATEISSIWWRRPVTPLWDDERTEADAAWSARETRKTLEGYLRAADAHWVNTLAANTSADCKPEQLQRAGRHGFEVPPTLITGRREEATAFIDEHWRVVCKAVSDGRLPAAGGDRLFFTTEVTQDSLREAPSFGPEPYIFQELIEKTYDVRVTVIGDGVYACRIDSGADPSALIDWRAGTTDLPHAIETLPQSVADCCRTLTASYGLRFAAIDLVRHVDGGYLFLELNPNGQWAWVEQQTAMPLRARLADELLGLQ
jgi:glutathione synthase/RimK-type ligase-like ATP-grasp enzyme